MIKNFLIIMHLSSSTAIISIEKTYMIRLIFCYISLHDVNVNSREYSFAKLLAIVWVNRSSVCDSDFEEIYIGKMHQNPVQKNYMYYILDIYANFSSQDFSFFFDGILIIFYLVAQSRYLATYVCEKGFFECLVIKSIRNFWHNFDESWAKFWDQENEVWNWTKFIGRMERDPEIIHHCKTWVEFWGWESVVREVVLKF